MRRSEKVTTVDAREDHRRRVGAFLRAQRKRLLPQEVGLGPERGRRGEGLRRSEVAALAYVSVTLYTWLEQGRDFPVSAVALNAVANALRLDESGRAYLMTLRVRDPQPPPKVQDVGPALRALIERHTLGPAYVMTRRWDIIMWNALLTEVFGVLDVAPWGAYNALWWVFAAERARTLYPDWLEMARRIVAQFRLDAMQHAGHDDFDELVERLRERSPEFAALWQRDDAVQLRSEGHIEVVDNAGERRRYATLTLVPQNSESLRAVFFFPVPEGA